MENFLLGFLFSMIGGSVFLWARNQPAIYGIGLLMMFYPYFTPNAYWTTGVGIVLIISVFLFKE